MTERMRELKSFYKLQVEAKKYNASLKEELAQRRALKKKIQQEENGGSTSNAEVLVKKKYRKEK